MRRNNEAYFFIAIFLSFLLLGLCFPYLIEASDVISSYKESIVSITVNDSNGQEVAKGSGFIIEQNGIITTTCSVLSGWYQDVQNTMTVTTAVKEAFPVDDVLSYNCRKNVALIKINAKRLPLLKIAINPKLKKWEAVIIIYSDTKGAQEARGKITKVSETSFESTISVIPEMIGSPVLTKKGEVIGIVTEPLKKRKRFSSIISAQEIANQLARYKKYAKRFQTARIPFSSTHIPSERKVSGKSETQIPEKPDEILNRYDTGYEQEKHQMYTDAIESFKEAIIMKPDSGEAYVNLGNAYYKVSRYADATYSYREAIRITRGDLSIHNKLGATLIILGEYKQAIDVFKEAVKIDPKDAGTYFNLGIAYFLDGDRSAAMNVHKALKELDRNRAQSLFELLE